MKNFFLLFSFIFVFSGCSLVDELKAKVSPEWEQKKLEAETKLEETRMKAEEIQQKALDTKAKVEQKKKEVDDANAAIQKVLGNETAQQKKQ